MMQKPSFVNYVPPGPVSRAFINDLENPITFIGGPPGSGKTTAAIFKGLSLAIQQPILKAGYGHVRILVVRDTLRALEKTFLESWLQWFPKGFGEGVYRGGNDRPIEHVMTITRGDGAPVKIETAMVGINGRSVREVLQGREITLAIMNEASELDVEVFDVLPTRMRYPSRHETVGGREPIHRLLGDFNFPDWDHWLFQRFVADPSPHVKLYKQPGGLTPGAENVNALPKGYYEQMAQNLPPDQRRRYVDAEWGYLREGDPVYPEFNEALHIAGRVLEAAPERELVVGMDAGLTPTAVFGQMTPEGQIRILDELAPGGGYGPTRFSELVLDRLTTKFRGCSTISLWADPASQYGGDREGGDLAWSETVSKALGMPVRIPYGGSNELGLRLDGVKQPLSRLIDGRLPGLILSPICKRLIRGFLADYHLGPTKVPKKNDASHIHDGLQYCVAGMRGRSSVVGAGALKRPAAVAAAIRRAGNFDPHGY